MRGYILCTMVQRQETEAEESTDLSGHTNGREVGNV